MGVSQTIADVLRPALSHWPDAPAVVARSGTLTYADLDRAAAAAAGAMWNLGVRPGDRVAACLPNDLGIVAAFHGAQRVGAIWVGINEAYPAAEQQAIADLAAPSLIVAGPQWKAAAGTAVGTEEWTRLMAGAPAAPRVELDPDAPVRRSSAGRSRTSTGCRCAPRTASPRLPPWWPSTRPAAQPATPAGRARPARRFPSWTSRRTTTPAGGWTPALGEWRDGKVVPAFAAPVATGDIGSVDADGWLTVVERRKLVIVRGGGNVYPAEVERVIRQHPAVTEVAVFGVPDERLGERVAALVQLDAEIPLAELESLCRQHLARYKVPELWSAVDRFPVNAMGKIIRTSLPGLLQGVRLR